MPVPPFGFSVGDFVSCASLIGDIIRALNDCKGSKPEYQALSETLQSLSQALTVSHVVYLQWDTAVLHPQYRDNASALLEGMGKVRQKCLDLMQKFLDKAQPYTDAFLRERGSRVTRDWRKVTWLFKKGDVKALREELNTHLQTLQEFTNAFFQNHLGAHTQVMYSTMGKMLASVSELKENVNTLSNDIQGCGQSIPAGLGYAWGTSPTIAENVLLLDATGRSLLLPMPFMTSPMLLHDLLNIMYRGLPGHHKITRREYIIADEDRDGSLIDPANWSSIIHPGMQISLNVVFSAALSWNTQYCPRCNQPTIGLTLPEKRKRCHKCHLTFSLFEKERIVEQSQVSESTLSTGAFETEASSVNSAQAHQKLSTHRRKGHYASGEDYYFSRVHYHREVLKARPAELADPSNEEIFPMLQVDELPPLHKAAAKSDLTGIVAFLDAGEDINAPLPFQRVWNSSDNRTWSFKGCSPLHVAAWFGKSRAVRLLVARGANLYAHDAGLAEALHYAIGGENHGSIAVLLELGATVNVRDKWDQTPLHEACRYGSPLLSSLLLEKGADVLASDAVGWTPLHLAAKDGNTEIIEALVEYGANIDSAATDGSSPLHLAARRGHENAVYGLIECGADVNLKNKDGQTPLHDAAFKGYQAIVKALMDHGSELLSHDLCGWTPLDLASAEGHLHVVKLLIENGALVTPQSSVRETPVRIASRFGHLGVVQLLLDDIGDVNLRDCNGRTALHGACFGGHLPIFQFLLEKGADIHVQDDQGRSPLHHAAYGGHDKILQVLLRRGSDASIKMNDGTTALYWASNKGHLSTVKILLQHGADVNSQSNNKETAIHAGIFSGSEEIVRALLEAGCNPYLQDMHGRNPLDISLKESFGGMAMLLAGYMLRDEVAFVEFTAGLGFEDVADRILGAESDDSDWEDIQSGSES